MREYAVLLALLACLECVWFTSALNATMLKLAEAPAFDIDKARDQFIKTARYQYINGCRQGAEQQQDIKDMKETGTENYDITDIASYCRIHYEDYPEEGVMSELSYFGKR